MTSKRAVVRVMIAGEEYIIRTDAPAEHTRAVAAYVDNAIKTVLKSGTIVESHKAAILAALQITDGLNALAADVRRWLPPAKRAGDE